MYNFDPYNVFLVIATNIPVRLMTSFVVQGRAWKPKKMQSVHSEQNRYFNVSVPAVPHVLLSFRNRLIPVNNVIFLFYFFAYNNNNNKVQRFLYSKIEKEKTTTQKIW